MHVLRYASAEIASSLDIAEMEFVFSATIFWKGSQKLLYI